MENKNYKELFNHNTFSKKNDTEGLFALFDSNKIADESVLSKWGLKIQNNLALHIPTLEALVFYLQGDERVSIGTHSDFNIAMFEGENTTQFAVYNRKLRKVVKLCYIDSCDMKNKNMLCSEYHRVTAAESNKVPLLLENNFMIVFLAMMPEFIKNICLELKCSEQDLKNLMEIDITTNKFCSDNQKKIFTALDNIYRSVIECNKTSDAPNLEVEYPDNGDPSLMLDIVSIKSYLPTKIICGDFSLFEGMPSEKSETELKTFSICKDEELTEEQKRRIPKLESWYIPPMYLMNTLKVIKCFHNSPNQFQNILFSGRAGSGKSKSAEAIAYALNLPFYAVNCNPNTDEMQLTGGFAPNINKGEIKDLPTFEEIEFDPATAYKRITGEDNENVSSEEVFRLVNAKKEEKSNDFIVTTTALIEAAKNGGVVELQEISLIKDSGMLGMLNSLMDNENPFLTVPTTGEVIPRHKNCVIVATTNINYAGCRPLNAAVKDRFKVHYLVENPTEEEIFARTKAKTNFKETSILKKMVKAFCEISSYREDSQEEDSATLRSLYNWVYFYMAMEGECSVYEAAQPTLVNKLSSDIEERIEANNILQKYFS